MSSSQRFIGCVKWFNNKAGYGFVTYTDSNSSETDVFVHHSAINVDSQQYKYLVQGEYIEFDLIRVESEKHEWQASRISGIHGGKIMCETRNELKNSRNEYKTANQPEHLEVKLPRQKSVAMVSHENPRDENKKVWTLVGKKEKVMSDVTQKRRQTSKASK
jgi:CspA family cold shock protein